MKTIYQCVAAFLAAIFVAGVLVLIFPPKARAQDGAAVKLFDEPCRLTDMVSNLPRRATWTEGQKVFEGCWGQHRQAPGVVQTFWEDKTVVPIMMDEMRRLDVRPALSI